MLRRLARPVLAARALAVGLTLGGVLTGAGQAGAQPAGRLGSVPYQATAHVDLTTQSEDRVTLAPVPSGKLLVIEHVGVFSHVGQGLKPLTVLQATGEPGQAPNVGLPVALQTTITFAIPKDAYGGSFPMKVLVPAGQSPVVFFARYGALTDAFATFTLTGQLVDAP